MVLPHLVMEMGWGKSGDICPRPACLEAGDGRIMDEGPFDESQFRVNFQCLGFEFKVL